MDYTSYRAQGRMLNLFQVMPVGARILSDVRIGFGRHHMWERKNVLLNAYVVEFVNSEASCCNLYNSRLDAFKFGGLYFIMQI